MLYKFVFYGVIGWIAEIIFTGLGSLLSGSVQLSAHTYLWMFPIYGLAVFLEPIHARLRSVPWMARGIVWACLIFFIEYVSGWLLKTSVGVCPWDYSTYSRFALDGFIRLDYFPVWFAAGLIFEKVSTFINRTRITFSRAGEPDEDGILFKQKSPV